MLRERVAEKSRRILAEVSNYHDDVLIISAFDSHLNYAFLHTKSTTKIQARNRFFESGISPDFVVDFTNGYRLIVERKRSWNVNGEQDTLRQLERYLQLARLGAPSLVPAQPKSGSEPLGPTQGGDVVLLVGGGHDEFAAEAISGFQGLGPRSIVIFDSQQEAFKANNPTVRYTWRKSSDQNGTFCEPNVGDQEPGLNLNKALIGPERKFVARCDSKTLAEAGECAFLNDSPPAYYTICHVLLPVINDLLKDGDRDSLASDGEEEVTFAFDKLLDASKCRFERVPEGKLSEWLHAAIGVLINLKVMSRVYVGKSEVVKLQLDAKNERLDYEKMVQRMAMLSVRSQVVVVSRDPRTTQLRFEFEGPN